MPWIDVEVTAISPAPVERDISVEVPDGMHVVGMDIEIGGEKTSARTMPAADATERFLGVVHARRDPALLEEDEYGRVVLHVFPIERDRPAHVRLTVAPDAGVDATTSLYAETPPPPAHGRVPHVISDPIAEPAFDASLDPHEIRALVRLHEPQLRRCYSVELQRDHALAGTAELHFVVGTDGAVESAVAGGSLPSPDALACLAHEVATWRFREGDRPVAVNYPLTFEPPPQR